MGISSGIGVTGQMPTGSVVSFAGSSAPVSWLLCSGQTVSRTVYSNLFAIIGTTYGSGDGSTTFNVPDMRGRVPAGLDNMGGSSANRITSGNSGITGTTLGAFGGDERTQSHTHTQASHSHAWSGYAAFVIYVGGSPANPGGQFSQGTTYTYATNNASYGYTSYTGGNAYGTNDTQTPTINSYGSGGSQNVQPTIMLNYIIKA